MFWGSPSYTPTSDCAGAAKPCAARAYCGVFLIRRALQGIKGQTREEGDGQQKRVTDSKQKDSILRAHGRGHGHQC